MWGGLAVNNFGCCFVGVFFIFLLSFFFAPSILPVSSLLLHEHHSFKKLVLGSDLWLLVALAERN